MSRMHTAATEQPCPCGRADGKGRPLLMQACCGRWLAGQAAPEAESLMRSRYTAYVLNDEAYLLATWHPETRPAELQLDAATRWLGLEVRSHRLQDDSHAQVEFVARYRVGGRGARLQERSRFIRHDGRWYYHSGELS